MPWLVAPSTHVTDPRTSSIRTNTRCSFATQPESVFIESAHCELLRRASQHMQRIASEHLLHPKTRRTPVHSI